MDRVHRARSRRGMRIQRCSRRQEKIDCPLVRLTRRKRISIKTMVLQHSPNTLGAAEVEDSTVQQAPLERRVHFRLIQSSPRMTILQVADNKTKSKTITRLTVEVPVPDAFPVFSLVTVNSRGFWVL